MDNVLAIAICTFRELVRSKVLYLTLFFGAVLVLVAAAFGSVTIGDQVRVIKDFGLMSISLFSIAFAVISGSSLLAKELNKKTVYNILAKPVKRSHFLFGKYLGMCVTSTLMVTSMGIALTGYLFIFEKRIDLLLWQAIGMTVIELWVVCAAAVFFSTVVVTPLLSGMFTFGLFVAGRCSSYVLYFIGNGNTAEDGFFDLGLKCLYWLLPHFDLLNIGNQVVFGLAASWDFMFWSWLYGAAYSGALLVCANVIFKSREFN